LGSGPEKPRVLAVLLSEGIRHTEELELLARIVLPWCIEQDIAKIILHDGLGMAFCCVDDRDDDKYLLAVYVCH
jgi:hypothetical protein